MGAPERSPPADLYFHITTREAWEHARAAGVYVAASLTSVGFIHLSLDRQWPLARTRFFAGATDLVLLVIDPRRLTHEVRFEPADGDSFPHLYGALNLDAVAEVRVVPDRPEGTT
ncbi:MAG: DUF952 domain-containing protein [Polyangiaceae bacterium]